MCHIWPRNPPRSFIFHCCCATLRRLLLHVLVFCMWGFLLFLWMGWFWCRANFWVICFWWWIHEVFCFWKKARKKANHAQFAHVLCICPINFRQKWWPKIVQAEFAGKPFVEVVPLDLVSPETSNFFAVPRAEMRHLWESFYGPWL